MPKTDPHGSGSLDALTSGGRGIGRSDELALLHELDHRVKNNLQLMAALVSLESRHAEEPAVRAALSRVRNRLQALGTVHRGLYNRELLGLFDLARFVRDLAADLVVRHGRPDIVIRAELEPVMVRADKAAPIALIINELLAEVLDHGFVGAPGGVLSLTLDAAGVDLIVEMAGDVGARAGPMPQRSAAGGVILDVLSRQLGARIEREAWNLGWITRVRLPLGVRA